MCMSLCVSFISRLPVDWGFTLQAVYQVIVLLVLNFGGMSILHLKHDTSYHADKVKNTLIFNAFVICQVSLIILYRSMGFTSIFVLNSWFS